MSRTGYDVIVVGARCAGSPAAMLLARMGYRVLLLDRATFPSDTVSTHLLQPRGVAALRRWGLLDRLRATGCPPIRTYAYDFDSFVISGSPGTVAEPAAYGPRRIVLDKMLVDAASEAGAEVREGFTVSDVVFGDDGRVVGVRGRERNGPVVAESARVVVGADGLNSLVARAVGAQRYREKPRLMCGYYTYFSGLEMDGVFEAYARPYRGFTALPTHDGLTMVIGTWPYADFNDMKKDLEGNYFKNFELVPAFAERIRGARREARLAGMAVPNFFRKPFGPGWALVGDAGYNKDPITAQGISDAFSAAELCANALDDAFSGRQSYDTAMAEYQAVRDEHALPVYEFTAELATLAPPTGDLLRVLKGIEGDPEAMNAFIRVNSGLDSLAEFFAEWSGAPAMDEA
ncbi:NAD(P)/FAD-dependent oxidoreductase [Saccharopolyspora indica]|uniref:NAD(P)/FAD-dependent oxidoreductase n=1 Tax=Saccharopolyspora indica TaxID=1229659 RepID=UPI0022EB3111|nr:NAD(P)/FAD-dependent oxidoreductase [Saccharopolyspora indica]MDA3648910.1 NAD(P)/FAD-dependent oxidoreductase [Saccharopolyspora indica]